MWNFGEHVRKIEKCLNFTFLKFYFPKDKSRLYALWTDLYSIGLIDPSVRLLTSSLVSM